MIWTISSIIWMGISQSQRKSADFCTIFVSITEGSANYCDLRRHCRVSHTILGHVTNGSHPEISYSYLHSFHCLRICHWCFLWQELVRWATISIVNFSIILVVLAIRACYSRPLWHHFTYSLHHCFLIAWCLRLEAAYSTSLCNM